MSKKIPRIKGNIILGNVTDLAGDILAFMKRSVAQYGDFSEIRMLHKKMYFLNHPDQVRHVLQENNRNYYKGDGYKHMKLAMGEGLLTSNGDFWLKQRRTMQPAFHRKEIASLFNIMVEEVKNWISSIKNNKITELEINSSMAKLTLAIATRTLFTTNSLTETEKISASVEFLNEFLNKRVTAILKLPTWLPLPRLMRYTRALKRIESTIDAIIQKRKKSGEQVNDLLGMLLSAKDGETGMGMSDRQLRDEVITIFIAGHETTSNALSWIWYMLSENPAAASNVRQEAEEVFGGRDPVMEDIPKLNYTSMVIQETMRIYPPGWIFERTAAEDDVIDGYKIKKGRSIWISPYMVHRHSSFWKEPENFIPERFSPENSKDRDRFSYIPFGGGPRQCIGSNFAMMQMQVTVAMIARNFSLKAKAGQKIEMEPLITLRPKNGIRMNISGS